MKVNVKNNVYWLGYIDQELRKFHGDDYSTSRGSSQNAYLIKEEKTVLVDTVWRPHRDDFLKNLESEIDLNEIDYIVVNHGEVDHSGVLPELLEKIPNTPIYCTAQAVKSLVGQYHHPEWNFNVVKTGDELDVGNGKKLIFIQMTMLHWPDSMATFLTGDNILFSMDAFGQHYASESLFDDLANMCDVDYEAMKYWVNIINPFADFMKRKFIELDKLNLPVEIIAPSHGIIWRKNPQYIIDKYRLWCDNYQENQITIVYQTMWEATQKLANSLAAYLREVDPSVTVKVLNIDKVDKNDVMTEIFKSKAVAFGCPTVGKDMMTNMSGLIHFAKEISFKNKKACVFGAYGWSGEGNSKMKEALAHAGFEVLDPEVKCNWNPTDEDFSKTKELAIALCNA